MKIKIEPKRLHGNIDAISSKSYAHRILLASALCKESTKIYINHFSKDILASINAIKSLGATVIQTENYVLVSPNIVPEALNVFADESGTTARLILPIMTAISEKGTLNGAGSLLTRPFSELCECMEENGVNFENHNLPITYKGKLQSGTFNITGSKSSQYISGLMFALPLLSGGSKINLTTNLESSGYVNMTIDVLKMFSVDSSYDIKGNQNYISPKEITVEGDWSNASYWLCLKDVKVNGLNNNSLQKDKLFKDVCNDKEIDAREIPDLVPALAVYATNKKFDTKIYNIERLRIKESDRVASVCHMIRALGGEIEEFNNYMIIKAKKLTGGTVNSHNDHRIVMASATASCFCTEPVLINGAAAVNKSYPDFFKHFNALGGNAYVL